jgi:hypothetical protein
MYKYREATHESRYIYNSPIKSATNLHITQQFPLAEYA